MWKVLGTAPGTCEYSKYTSCCNYLIFTINLLWKRNCLFPLYRWGNKVRRVSDSPRLWAQDCLPPEVWWVVGPEMLPSVQGSVPKLRLSFICNPLCKASSCLWNCKREGILAPLPVCVLLETTRVQALFPAWVCPGLVQPTWSKVTPPSFRCSQTDKEHGWRERLQALLVYPTLGTDSRRV